MNLCISGSRGITDYEAVVRAIMETLDVFDIPLIRITRLLSGGARGVDRLAERWARENGIEVKPYIPNWDDLKAPNAVIRTNKWGKKYNATAGHDRNLTMCKDADVVAIVWDGASPGTKNMIKNCEYWDARYHVVTVVVPIPEAPSLEKPRSRRRLAL